ncbi:hypothetical protein K438DRAFT_1777779 [Mycena galopus ATCC 62051]|nr:hypothetical protein K438DRAFT_1777779 [Mycena galopus ATCC 62051]
MERGMVRVIARPVLPNRRYASIIFVNIVVGNSRVVENYANSGMTKTVGILAVEENCNMNVNGGQRVSAQRKASDSTRLDEGMTLALWSCAAASRASAKRPSETRIQYTILRLELHTEGCNININSCEERVEEKLCLLSCPLRLELKLACARDISGTAWDLFRANKRVVGADRPDKGSDCSPGAGHGFK